jgi:hypothetical protein
MVTEETAADVIVTGVPTGRKHATPADGKGGGVGAGVAVAVLPRMT